MARILVAADARRVAETLLADDILRRMGADGHDAVPLDGDVLDAVRDADAVVALDPERDGVAAACLGVASQHGKPSLLLRSPGAPSPLDAMASQVVELEATGRDRLGSALETFYEAVRPYAGRLVRDRIPQLVKEAGHELRFRTLGDDEKPRFLKQKIANEAQQLQQADLGKEKEEVADVLEALEALIRVRGFDRESLRAVKQGKLKRRGGFDRCFVVEATADKAQGPGRQGAGAGADTAMQDAAPEDPRDAEAGVPAAMAPHADRNEEDREEDPSAFDDIPEVAGELVDDRYEDDETDAVGPDAAGDGDVAGTKLGEDARRRERPRTPIFEA